MAAAAVQVTGFLAKETFERDLRKAPPDIQRAAKAALKNLLQNPQPRKLRLHSITGCFDPRILKIDVLANHSWQITFEMDGTTALLRRLGTHKFIDNNP